MMEKRVRIIDFMKLKVLMIRLYFVYGVSVIFKTIYQVFRRKANNTFDAIVEIRPDLRNKLTEKFY